MLLLTKLQLLALAAFVLYLLYYFLRVVGKPRLICSSANMRAFLSLHCAPLVEACFWPPIWCIGANVQYVTGLVFQVFQPLLPYNRQLLVLPDGGTVALDWLNEDLPPPVVLFLTGLTGDSQACYLRTLVPMVARLRCPCVVLNNRGHGGLPLVNHKIVSALSTDDLSEVVAAIHERYPRGCELVAVGYSLGGVLLSHYLLQTGDAAHIDAGISISAPFHLPTSFNNLMSCSTNFLVNVYLANWMLGIVRKHRSVFDSSGKLSTIRRPLLFLVAADDVFGSLETLPAEEIEQSPWLSAVVTPRGGHLGFVDGWLWPRAPFYCERLVLAYVRGLLELLRGPRGPLALKNLAGVPVSGPLIGADRETKQEDHAIAETSAEDVRWRNASDKAITV